ncbi:type I polyketide synthase [Limnoglobus roseus]|uniref:Type I polyketide synthase n=1 Tax=Limnoglobus roseus TaxID=2598579 RepID=A0A5C1A8G9_9BACT|nr:type I polyketide synthase [Limnoglobus roseus]QEL14306.1 type I polyketide synthase [Limnoglobus roseus]
MPADRVAIVGMAGRFPGSGADLDLFWQNVLNARDCSREVPPGRWFVPADACLDSRVPHPDAVYSTRGYYLTPFEADTAGLDIPADLLSALDPLFHLVLDVGNRAWKSAKTEGVNRRKVGVVLGNICLPTDKANDLAREYLGSAFGISPKEPTHPLNRFPAGLPAGLLAKTLGLGGGTFTLDAACASSLYALKLAADELLARRADVMLAGGCSRPDSQYTQMGFSQLRALSPTGRCSPFDATADGLVVGEGAGIFVLKRLSDALAVGDTIHAVIAGAGLSNDMVGNLLAPAVEGQLRAMRDAYGQAGWSPTEVDLIECHATGTPVGDAVEFESLHELWRSQPGWKPGQCVIGSVKSTVGHLLTGAGAAAAMKVVRAMAAGKLPPQANFEMPPESFEYETAPFRVLPFAEEWKRRGKTRKAAVSGFGFGGVNAHLLLEEWKGQIYAPRSGQASPRLEDSIPGTELLSKLRRMQARVKELTEGHPDDPEAAEVAVAVVGMAAHCGSLATLREFQEFVLGGTVSTSGTTTIPELHVPLDRFRIPPKELEELLPQQLLMLQTAAAALDDCHGKDDAPPDGDPRTGVFVGLGLDLNTTNFHIRWAAKQANPEYADFAGPPLNANRVMGALGSIAASRIARAFHFGGPSFTVCSEETSAGRALELAVRAVRAGELDRAVVGGVELTSDPRALAANDHMACDGAAAVVLKRLSAAQADGDRVYAVIRGVGSASGGSVSGTSPDAATYASSLMRACLDANADPAQIGYLETAEDAEERRALETLLEKTKRDVPLVVGSAKLQVGHAGFASPLVGFVKAALALYQNVLPPGGENAALPNAERPTTPRYWLHDRTAGPRRAAVGAVGVDGSSFHVVLDEHVPTVASPRIVTEQRQPLGSRQEAVFVVDGDTPAAIVDGLGRLFGWLPAQPRPIESLARDWFRRVAPDPRRKLAVTLVAKSLPELKEQIEYALRHVTARGDAVLPPPKSPALRDRVFFNPYPIGRGGKVAFVYPGSGNQFAGMGRDLAASWPSVLRKQHRENQRLRSQYAPQLFWGDAISDESTPRDFLFGQVTLGTLTSDLLQGCGVHPAAMVGQSLGESAGLFGLRVWTARDEMYRRIQTSTLFSTELGPPYDSARAFYGTTALLDWTVGLVTAAPDTVRAFLRPTLRAYLLIVTTPNECVIGGVRADVEKLALAIGQPFLPLDGVTLAHCEAGKPVEPAYRDLHTLPVIVPPGVKFYSGAWGREYKMTEDNAADSITAGLVGTIEFPNVVEAAYRDGVRTFLEMGPGASTSRMIDAILGDRPHLARSVCVPRQDAVSLVLRTLANLIAERVPVNLEAIYGGESACVDHLPADTGSRRTLTVPTAPPVRLPHPVEVDAEPEPQPEVKPVVAEIPPPPPPVEEAPQNVPVEEVLLPWEPPAEPVVPEYSAPLTQTPPPVVRPAVVPTAAVDVSPFLVAAAAMQQATADAHAMFLTLQQSLMQTSTAALMVQTQLEVGLSSSLGAGGYARDAGGVSSSVADTPHPPVGRGQGLPPSGVPRSLTFEQCTTFAVGKIGDVLGPTFAEIDAHPTRVRLPEGPLMLVDRVLRIDGEPRSMKSGRVVTDHTVRPDRWYLDSGRCPTSVTVEAGQADLFLSGFLGIDFITKGNAVYRLLDAVVSFHRGLPTVGERIEYDIHVDEFFNQADAWLFRFRFEGTVNGEPLLSMKDGVAGFFTQAALEAGQGIIHTKLDRQPAPGKRPDDWTDLVPQRRMAVDEEGVEALRRGDLVTAFGPDFAKLPLKSPMKLPGGMLRLVDRVADLDPVGGRFGLGFVRAEYDLRPKEWFIECHFVDDKVMPGTLMYECCLHTLRVLLMRMGWVGEDGQVVCEPVPEVNSRLKCRGQVLETTKLVTYEISVKEFGYGPAPFCIADALMYADGKPIVEITNLSLRMTGLTRDGLTALWNPERKRRGEEAVAHPVASAPGSTKTAIYDSAKIMAYSNGKPSEAFGEPYRVFDEGRVLARLPGPPFQFLDCITAVTGEPFVLKAGASCEAQYAVPPDAWYFSANRSPRMPFSVLLEIALQPCGWLAAYCGSALTSLNDLSFRNLGGKAKQYVAVTPDTGTLTTNVKMTQVSSSGGMIIQHYDMLVTNRGQKVYEGSTYFGFFSKESLVNQVGMPTAKVPYLTAEQTTRPEKLPHAPPFPDAMMRMVDVIEGYVPTGGCKGLGLIQGRIAVDPSFWFFKAHFYQDPVWPGSLGLESFLQLFKYVAFQKFGPPPAGGWQTVGLNREHSWVYRGQVVPTDQVVTVVLEVTAEDQAHRRLTADGFLIVDGRIIYQMTGFTLE